MDTTTPIRPCSVIPPEVMAEMLHPVECAMRGRRDPEAMRKARESMDRRHENILSQHGLLDLAVPTNRELRGELPDE